MDIFNFWKTLASGLSNFLVSRPMWPCAFQRILLQISGPYTSSTSAMNILSLFPKASDLVAVCPSVIGEITVFKVLTYLLYKELYGGLS